MLPITTWYEAMTSGRRAEVRARRPRPSRIAGARRRIGRAVVGLGLAIAAERRTPVVLHHGR